MAACCNGRKGLRRMKFWFTKKSPKDLYDAKAPFDATVEEALRFAREVNATPVEADREVFDFAKAFTAKALTTEPFTTAPLAPQAAPQIPAAAPATPPRPAVSRTERAEMERRIASYRAFQVKLNEEREARIRRTMDGVRAQLKQTVAPDQAH